MPQAHPLVSPNTVPVSQAHEVLLEMLDRIAGVRVTKYVSRPLGQPVLQVEVEPGVPDAESAVYRAEMEVYQQFPDARIEVYVI
jgi:hypothetical protein